MDSYGEFDWSKEDKEKTKMVRAEDVADMIVYYASLPLNVLVEDIVFNPFTK